MKQYHYQETLIINVTVFANSKKEARERAESPVGQGINSFTADLLRYQDVKDFSIDSSHIQINEEK